MKQSDFKYKLILEKIKKLNIEVIDYEMKSKSFILLLDGKKYIAINPKLTENERFYVLTHELSHIELNNEYVTIYSSYRINMIERKTNDRTIVYSGLTSKILELKNKYNDDEIKKILQVPDDIYIETMQRIRRCLYEK